jgi:PIN domain nuclease of toxin-antitoxin system
MPALVADTHVAIWHLANDPRLSPAAVQAIEEATAAGDPIWIPSISLVEITYLVEKGKLLPVARERLMEMLRSPSGAYQLAPLDGPVADAVQQIPRDTIPDLPDRVIAATALALNVPLVSRDGKLRASQIQTIW